MHNVAAICVGLATALIVGMDWIATPLNRNIDMTTSRQRLPGSVIHLTTGAVLCVLCALHVRFAEAVAALWYGFVLVAAIRNWWVPYFFARYPGEITPSIYAREYIHNLTILPEFKDHPVVPDVQHMLIHASVASAWLASGIAAITGA